MRNLTKLLNDKNGIILVQIYLRNDNMNGPVKIHKILKGNYDSYSKGKYSHKIVELLISLGNNEIITGKYI